MTEKSLIKTSNPDHVTVLQVLPDTYHTIRNNQNLNDEENIRRVHRLASTLLKMHDANQILREVDNMYWNALVVHNYISGKSEPRSASTPIEKRLEIEKSMTEAMRTAGIHLQYLDHKPYLLTQRVRKENAVLWE